MAALKERERVIVQKIWKDAINKYGGTSEFGIAAFNLLFAQHPDYIQLFSAFQGISPSDLRTDPRLKAQATNVFAAFNMVIENLSDTEFQDLMAKKLGKDHIARNISQDNFEALEQVILTLLEKTLGGQVFSSFARSSFEKALAGIVAGISKNL